MQVEHTEAVAVALVSVALHALPGNVLAIRTEGGIGVVAGHHVATVALFPVFLAEIGGDACLYIIKVYVGVGRDAVGKACLLAAGVGNELSVGAPGELLHTAEGLHGRFVRLAFEDVFGFAHLVAIERGHVGVGDCLYPLVPMLVHEVVDDDTG